MECYRKEVLSNQISTPLSKSPDAVKGNWIVNTAHSTVLQSGYKYLSVLGKQWSSMLCLNAYEVHVQRKSVVSCIGYFVIDIPLNTKHVKLT